MLRLYKEVVNIGFGLHTEVLNTVIGLYTQTLCLGLIQEVMKDVFRIYTEVVSHVKQARRGLFRHTPEVFWHV